MWMPTYFIFLIEDRIKAISNLIKLPVFVIYKFMRRFIFYISVGLLTFGVGCFLAYVFQYCYVSEESTINKKVLPNNPKQKVGNLAALSIKGKSRLADPVCESQPLKSLWNELKKDKVFEDWLGWKKSFSEDDNCADLLRIEIFDLNSDGAYEFLVRGDSSFCSMTCNCAFWVLKEKNGKFQIILSGNSYLDGRDILSQIQKSRTNNFKNILLEVRVQRNAHAYKLYKFDGKKYRERNCNIHQWNEFEPDEKTKIMNCREFEKKNYKLGF